MSMVQQTFATPGVAPPRLAAVPLFGLRGAVQVPLPWGMAVGLDLEGVTYLFRREGPVASPPSEPRAEAQLVGRGSLFVGLQL
jgi:hypothetical protein